MCLHLYVKITQYHENNHGCTNFGRDQMNYKAGSLYKFSSGHIPNGVLTQLTDLSIIASWLQFSVSFLTSGGRKSFSLLTFGVGQDNNVSHTIFWTNLVIR